MTTTPIYPMIPIKNKLGTIVTQATADPQIVAVLHEWPWRIWPAGRSHHDPRGQVGSPKGSLYLHRVVVYLLRDDDTTGWISNPEDAPPYELDMLRKLDLIQNCHPSSPLSWQSRGLLYQRVAATVPQVVPYSRNYFALRKLDLPPEVLV